MRTIRLTGDYEKREAAANAAGCALVWHQHVNSLSATPTYALVEIAYPTTDREIATAKAAAAGYARIFGGGLGDGDGVKVLKDGERGESIIDNNREAYISEPAFGSNPAQAKMLADPSVQRQIAQVNVDAIRANYGDDALVGLSVGHRGKTSAPNDEGCEIVGTGLMEADVAEAIIGFMEEIVGSSQAGGSDMIPDFPKLGHIGVHRLHKGDDYLLAVTKDQLAAASAAGYAYDGVFDLAPGGTVPLHQYRNGQWHLYQDTSPGPAWVDEGVLANVHHVGRGATVYRLVKGSGHLYSLSSVEGAPAWVLEGPAFGLGVLVSCGDDVATLKAEIARLDARIVAAKRALG